MRLMERVWVMLTVAVGEGVAQREGEGVEVPVVHSVALAVALAGAEGGLVREGVAEGEGERVGGRVEVGHTVPEREGVVVVLRVGVRVAAGLPLRVTLSVPDTERLKVEQGVALGDTEAVEARLVVGLRLCVLLTEVLSVVVPLSRTEAVRDSVRVRERVRVGERVRERLTVTVGVKVAGKEVAMGLRDKVTVGLREVEMVRVQEMDWDTVTEAVRVASMVVALGLGDGVTDRVRVAQGEAVIEA